MVFKFDDASRDACDRGAGGIGRQRHGESEQSMKSSFRSWLAGFLAVFLSGLALAAEQQPLRIVALGDSLTAGFGLPEEHAFPAVLQRALRAAGHEKVTVVNAGVSGDTSTGGLARLEWALGDRADAVIVELGANDMLRGIDPAETEKALGEILSRLSAKKIPILLAGMIAAPGMGKAYEERFNAIYPRLAASHGAILYPFFLDGVANERRYLLNDGMHPNIEGVREIVRRILPKALELVGAAKSNQAARR